MTPSATALPRRLSSSLLPLLLMSLCLVNCVEPEVTSGAPAAPPEEEPPNTTLETRLLPDTEYTRDLEIFEHVKPLSPELAATLTKTDTTLTFSDSSRSADFEIGDVLVSDYQDGIFRVVLSSSTDAQGRLVLTTRPAKLEEAIASGELYLGKLAEEQLTPPDSFARPAAGLDEGSAGLLVQRQGLEFNKDLGWKGTLFEYDRDFAAPLTQRIGDDHIEITRAQLQAAVGAEVYARLETKLAFPPKVSITDSRITSNGKVVGELRVKLKSDDAFTYDETVTLVGPASQGALMTFETVEHTLLPGLFPLKFTFDMHSALTLHASADGELETEVGYRVVAGAGAGVEKKDGEWRFVHTEQLVPEQYGPVFRGEKNAEASAELTTMLKLTLGERANGFAELKPVEASARFSQQIDAETGICPTLFDLRAKGSFSGQLASIDIPILGTQTIMDEAIDRTLYDKTLIHYEEQLDLPGICDPNYMPPMPEGGTLLPGQKCDEAAADTCVATADCYKETCVTRGHFRVSTAWYEATDGDLYVKAPTGEVISYGGKGAGGQRDFVGSCTRECSTPGPYVENIYFDESAPDGTYQVWLRNYDGKAGSRLDVEIRQADQSLAFSGELPAGAREQSEVFEFQIEGGMLVGGMSVGM